MSEPAIEEVNRYIHYEILNKCRGFRIVPYGVSLSGTVPCGCPMRKGDWHKVPDYCSGSTAREVLDEVVAKVEADGHGNALAESLDGVDDERDTSRVCWWPTAEQIARAVMAADMASKEQR